MVRLPTEIPTFNAHRLIDIAAGDVLLRSLVDQSLELSHSFTTSALAIVAVSLHGDMEQR